METNKGATIWARQTVESEIFFYKPDKWFKIWFYVVNRVNHKDSKLFKKGEGLITYTEIMGKCRATKAQVEKFMKWAEKEEMIASTRTTRGRIRFIVNYARFQDLSFYKEDLKKTTEKTSGRVAEELEKVPIDKNVKNERMKEEKYMSEKEFEEFWKRYPRKENKKKAREKFLKLPLKDFSKIKEGLSRALASRQWKIDGIIPHPTTWINGERWNDEAEEAPEEQKGICF